MKQVNISRAGLARATGSCQSPSRSLALLFCTILLVLCSVTSASASYDPIASGQTKLSLDHTFLAVLKQEGVHLSAIHGARKTATALVLPVSGGTLDPTIGQGEIESEGTLFFKRGKRSVAFRRLLVKTSSTPFSARVGGTQFKVLSGPTPKFARSGFDSNLSASNLRLTTKVATRLDKKLRLGPAFRPGQLVGSLQTTTAPQTVAILPTGKAILTPNQSFLTKLGSLHVSLNPIFPAEVAPGPILSFPITTEGALAPDASSGVLRTIGGIELLRAGAIHVLWHELWFDFTAATGPTEVALEPVPGPLGQLPAFGLSSSTAAISSDPKARTITAAGVALSLAPQTATALNQAYAEGGETFRPGDPVGTVAFTAQGQ